MKKKIAKSCAFALGVMLCAGNALANPLWVGTFNGIPNVNEFDWQSNSSGLATGVLADGQLTVGETFDFLYQSILTSVTDTSYNTISMSSYATQFTIGARIPEVVTPNSNLPGFAEFQTLAGGYFAIYADTNKNATVATGVGFTDGTKILEGTIRSGQTSSFTLSTPTTGKGFASILADVTFADSAYFDPATVNGNPFLINFDWTGTLQIPAVNTAGFFDTNSNFTRHTVNQSDLLFKVDGNNTFQAVPEPGSLFLLGTGLVGLARAARRKGKK